MNHEKNNGANTPVTAAIANSFKSTLFMVIAILLSVISAALLISLFISFNIVTLLSLAFSAVSTIFAWLLFAGSFSNTKVKYLRLYMAYSKIMNTILVVIVCVVVAVLLIGCIVLNLVSDALATELVPALEEDFKPTLEEIVEHKDELDNLDTDELEDMLEDMPQEMKDMFNIETIEDIQELYSNLGNYAVAILDHWDDIINFLNSGFVVLTVIVAIVGGIIIAALILVGKAYKGISKFLRALAENNETERKAPYVMLFIGGALIAIGGIVSFATDIIGAISSLAEAAVLIIFALFFKELVAARNSARLAAEANNTCEASADEEIGAVEDQQ